jgi:hypothetical protein
VDRICWFAVALAPALPSLVVRICKIFDAPYWTVVQRDDHSTYLMVLMCRG